MSNLETRSEESVIATGRDDAASPAGGSAGGSRAAQQPLRHAHTIQPRTVPLGGIRGIQVQRTLPDRTLPMVGAWCFFDAFDSEQTPMRVLPHPHTGLQTVTWPLQGRIRHRDALGSDVVLLPGQLNLMTSGAGISHSEFSLEAEEGEAPGQRLHGLQLWVALPDDAAEGLGRFEHIPQLPEWSAPGIRAAVLLGEFDGVRSPAQVHTPLVGAQFALDDDGEHELALRTDWEYAVHVIDGALRLEQDGLHQDEASPAELAPGPLRYFPPGARQLRLRGAAGTRFLLIGGEPFTEPMVMWWNFIARDHEAIVQAREDWEAGSARFGTVAGHGTERIPAPPMPGVRLTPRRRMPPLPER